VFLLASITDQVADWATNVVGDLGIPGIFLLMVPESAGIPIPSEATMLFAGFNVHEGEYPLWAAILAGTVANVIGSWILYGIGYYGRTDVLVTYGRRIHITEERLAQADRWFEKYGSAAVFFSRMLPVVRTFISLPAGVARMNFWKFTIYTFLGALVWVSALTVLGDQVGSNWTKWKAHLHYVDYAVAGLLVLGVIYLVIRWWRRRGDSDPAAPAAPDVEPTA
jgi:membrane protein DedA with SNARE-associated domain